MRRKLFEWQGVTIWSYPAMLYVGLVAGVVVGNVAAHATNINAFRVFVATILLITVALLGARLLYVVSNWNLYRHDLARVWNRNEGGFAMLGGLPLALLVSVPLLAAFQLSFGGFWDVTAFTILVGMAITRIGCLLNGCCSGRASQSWIGVNLPNHQGVWKRRIPTQCLEAAWAVVLLLAAAATWRWFPFPGALFLGVMAGYGAGRLILESTREQSRPGGITAGHAISAVMVVSALVILVVMWPR